MNYLIHPDAQAEVQTAAEHYERARPGLGHEFADEYDRVLSSILANPGMYPRDEVAPMELEARYWVLSRFPFRIVYMHRESGVYILAVAHHSRKPGYWHDRLSDATPEVP